MTQNDPAAMQSSAQEGPGVGPSVPHTVYNSWNKPYEVELSWTQDGEVDLWRVMVTGGSTPVDLTVGEPEIGISDIPYESELQVAVTAVGGGQESEPLTITLPDVRYTPAGPVDLAVTPGDGMLDLSWAQSDCCQHWQIVWYESDVRRRNPNAAPGGRMQVFGQPTCRILNLKRDTSYDVLVTARWRRSGYSEPTTHAPVSTLGEAVPVHDDETESSPCHGCDQTGFIEGTLLEGDPVPCRPQTMSVTVNVNLH